MTDMTNLDIHHDATAGRFTAEVAGLHCEAVYQLRNGVMHIVHTGVPPALQGRGIAAALVQRALDEARSQGWRVRPVCSYVQTYLRRHPASQDLLETR